MGKFYTLWIFDYLEVSSQNVNVNVFGHEQRLNNYLVFLFCSRTYLCYIYWDNMLDWLIVSILWNLFWLVSTKF